MEENKNLLNEVEVLDETDTEMSQILEGFETPKKDTNKKKKSSPWLKLLIAVLAVALIIGAIFLIIKVLPNNSENEEINLEFADISTAVDKDNIWQADIPLDEKGNIKDNGEGALLDLDVMKVDKIEISNKSGKYTVTSYTPVNDKGETDATEYTLVGFEDFQLQAGVASDMANDCCTTTFSKIIDVDATDNLADYGLDKPQATATITYDDKSKAIIKVGNTAPQSEKYYISFGTKNVVYLVDAEHVDTLLFDVTEFISKTINDSAQTSEDAEYEYITLSGKHYPQPITLEYNRDTDNITNSYMLTAPYVEFADNESASLVGGQVRGLLGTKVVYVNPTASDLAKYGLSEKYACVTAKFPDTTVKLIASKPDKDNNCYLIKDGGNIIYQIEASSISWVTTSYEDLVTEYVLSPKITGLDSVKVETSKDVYNFDLNTKTIESTNDEGTTTSSTTTTVHYDGKELTLGYFEIYLQNMSLIEKTDISGENVSGKPTLTITYSYDKTRDPDTVKFYKSGNSKYAVNLNGRNVGHVYASFVNKLIEQAPKVCKDISVTSFW